MKTEIKFSKKKILSLSAAMIMIFSALVSATACNCGIDKSKNIDLHYTKNIKNTIENMNNNKVTSLIIFNPQKNLVLHAGFKSTAHAEPWPNIYDHDEKTSYAPNGFNCNLYTDGGSCEWKKTSPTIAYATLSDSGNEATATSIGKYILIRGEADNIHLNASGNFSGSLSTIATRGDYCDGPPCVDPSPSGAYSKIKNYDPETSSHYVIIPFNVNKDCRFTGEAKLIVSSTYEDLYGETILEWAIKKIDPYYGSILPGSSGKMIIDPFGENYTSWCCDISPYYYGGYYFVVKISYEYIISSCASCCDQFDSASSDVEHNFTVNLTFFDPLLCPADFDGDGDVDTVDLLFLLAVWGTPNGDVDGDEDTDTNDLLMLLAAWGPCP